MIGNVREHHYHKPRDSQTIRSMMYDDHSLDMEIDCTLGSPMCSIDQQAEDRYHHALAECMIEFVD
jgi:hypothetical protein